MPSSIEMSAFDAFFGRFSSDVRKDLSRIHGVLWDRDDDVKVCRACRTGFTFSTRRHHCRTCGGVFCKSCLKMNAVVGDFEVRCACIGCCKGVGTGEIVNKLAAEHLGELAFQTNHMQTKEISLQYGSKYDPSSKNLPPPTSGYFEFFNKSDSPCAIKVLITGCDNVWEVPRPSYIVLGPNMTVYGEFGPSISLMDIIVLVNYPNIGSTLSGTSSDESSYESSKFRDFTIFRTHCLGCNVLLKYKDPGTVEPRQGGGGGGQMIGSALSLMTGSGSEKRRSQAITADIVDFRTNITKIDQLFSTFI